MPEARRFLLICSRLFCSLLAVWLLAAPTALCAGADDAMTQVQNSVDRIVEILRRDVAGEKWPRKRKEIVRIIRDRFASRELAQRVLARHWRERSEKQRDHFVELFADVLETTYINKLKSYSGEQIVFTRQLVKGDKAMVYSEIVRNNQEIPIDYRLLRSGDQWLIYDISVEGVSLVQNYRKQFDQIVKKEQFEGLVRRMEEKIEENRQREMEEEGKGDLPKEEL